MHEIYLEMLSENMHFTSTPNTLFCDNDGKKLLLKLLINIGMGIYVKGTQGC